MTISLTSCVSEVSLIIGDLAQQFQGAGALLSIETEIQNAMLFLTSNNEFSWNTRRVTGVTHSNGTITLPTGTARILYLLDSLANESYYNCPQHEYLIITNNPLRTLVYSQTTPIPYCFSVNETTGAEQIELATSTGTGSSLTFSMVITQSTTTPETVWVPDRIRPFVVSFTVANLATKIDNPDSNNLVTYHDKLAKMYLDNERGFALNRAINKTNMNLRTPYNFNVNSGGSYRL